MRVLYAAVCEGASERQDGRVDLHGIFQQLYAPGFPAQQDELTLAVAIEWDAGEQGRVAFRIDLSDPSGAPALTINGHSDVAQSPPGEAPPQTRLLMPMRDVVFPAAGTYLWELEMDAMRTPLAPLHLIRNPEVH